MGVSVKSGDQGGGSWVSISSGEIAVKSGNEGGGSWVYPATLHVKDGDLGEGSWVDSGYESYPNVPRNFAINSWNFSSLTVKWSAPSAGGAPVDHYDIELRNQANSSTIQSRNDSASPSAGFSVNQDTKYYVRIRSVAASGLTSSWVYIKPWIGHPQETSLRWVRKSQSFTRSGYWIFYKDYIGGVDPTPKYTSHGHTLGEYCTQARVYYDIRNWTSTLSSPSRYAYFRRNTDEGVKLTSLSGAWYGGPWGGYEWGTVINFGNDWSGGSNWGFYLTGSGWATSGGGTQVVPASVYIDGTRYYEVQEDYVSTSSQNNQYW